MSRRRLRPCRSSFLQPSGNTSGYARIRRAKSGEALQATEPSTSLEYPVLVRDSNYALSTIQDLQPTQQLLILTPFEFPNSSSDIFQKALLSNYSIPPTVFQLPYGNTQINPHAETAMRSAAQTIIFIDNADSDQMTLIKRTTDMQPLLIMIGPPSKHYFDFMENLRKKGSPPSSVLALVAASAQGLQNTARLIRWTAIQRKDEESVDALADSMGSYL
ncbi:hypothetical protein MMC16_007435 [Acarospora aff. strigata]|nr:hypothetical protein [Acarospora aff. strigata]